MQKGPSCTKTGAARPAAQFRKMLAPPEAGGVPQCMGFRRPRLVLIPQPLELAAVDPDEVIRN